ncbi:uncharacterized protein RJT20DRAFT_29935 [Scheffersomyces xylosifermentans]|uniref:uncharacterized protein n=1 Tax=Scheffersomyces xylosifermentans TaxID=1304137 RepID=UPI00315C72BF
MSDFSSYKKADLVTVLKKLEIHTVSKDTKKVLVDKLDKYVSEHPEDGALTIQSILDEAEDVNGDDEDNETTLNEDNDEIADEEEEEEVVVVVPETEDDDDKDYEAPPPLSLKEWVVDPVIEQWENFVEKVYEYTDSVGITYLEYSDDLRERLSKAITLNYLELVLEFAFFIYAYVPIVPLKDNGFNHQVLKDNIYFFGESEILTPDFTALLSTKVIATFVIWAFDAVLLPLLVAYYVNFSRRVLVFDNNDGIVARIYTYDPFVFALSKVLIYYFITKNSDGFLTFKTGDSLYATVNNFFVLYDSYYAQFTAVLGSFPLVLGASNILVALYSQFEEY